MYEIIIVILIIILFLIVMGMQKRIDTLIETQVKTYVALTEFFLQYSKFITSVSVNADAVSEALNILDTRTDLNYCTSEGLALHVSFLEDRIKLLEGKCNAL